MKACLASLADCVGRLVYVDSGSTDGSVRVAQAMGAAVLELDLRMPFTAGRARNEGLRRLRELAPAASKVQFVDGDCEVVAGWIARGSAWLDAHPEVAVVCGRRRERRPERSVYNRLCDQDWEAAPGQAKYCGGDAMVRVRTFDTVGGYRADLIAGEDPELCVRVRAAGWRIWRLDADMTRHDAAMTRFGQWWRRTVRGGYAYAAGVALHGAAPERHYRREWRSAWWWGLGAPLGIAGAALLWGAWPAGVLLLAYPVQLARIAVRGTRGARENWERAAFLMLGKFPEMLGQVKFLLERARGGRSALIEYK